MCVIRVRVLTSRKYSYKNKVAAFLKRFSQKFVIAAICHHHYYQRFKTKFKSSTTTNHCHTAVENIQKTKNIFTSKYEINICFKLCMLSMFRLVVEAFKLSFTQSLLAIRQRRHFEGFYFD